MVVLAVAGDCSPSIAVWALRGVLGDRYFDRLESDKEGLAADIEAKWPAIVGAVEALGGRFLDSEIT